MKIPEPEIKHKTWVYPDNDEIDEPSNEMQDVIAINIAVEKEPGSNKFTVIKANAPVKMNFGDFFYFVIEDYNLKNAEKPIYFANKYDQNYEWFFNMRPVWYATTRYIDPNLTIQQNKIADKKNVECHRILDKK